MRIELTEQQGRLHQFILKSFAEAGRSPTLAEVQTEFALDDEACAERSIGELEETKAIHRAPGDKSITHAYPFSNVATEHSVTLASGTEVYAMCAVDALGIPFMLKQDAAIESTCAHCGGVVNVDIEHGKISSHSPEALLVGYKPLDCCTTPATEQCRNINFFCSQRHLDEWLQNHPDDELKSLSLQQAVVSSIVCNLTPMRLG